VKRVLLLASYAPSLLNFRADLIRALVAAGHEVVCAAPAINDDIRSALTGMGCAVQSLELQRAGLNPLADLGYFSQLRRLMSGLEPDVLISYTIKPVVWGTLAAARAGVPQRVAMITGLGFAFTDGGGLKRNLARLAAKLLYRLALRRSTRIIFQNPDDRALFQQLGLLPRDDRTAIVNGSGVDTAAYPETPLPDGASFLMIARLLGDKGVREYGEAARIVKKSYPDVPVRLVGFLDESPDCIAQSELDAMIDYGVEFLGQLDDVRPAIANARIYVLPSYREGTPRSVLEAMSMGRAIITTDVPGCRETVVDGDNGLLVEARNAGSLAAAMIELIGSPHRVVAMGRRSRQIAVEKYDSAKVTEDIIKLSGL
jgi:glycosyltransferase involved in cell wall biosynthesis